jgi:beta-phosphoglucomutase
LAMKYLNVRPEECCVFEDSRGGVRAGKAAGVRTIGVTTTLSREEMLSLGADDTISDYTQIDIEKFLANAEKVTI